MQCWVTGSVLGHRTQDGKGEQIFSVMGVPVMCEQHRGNRRLVVLWVMPTIGMGRGASGVAVSGGTHPVGMWCWAGVHIACMPGWATGCMGIWGSTSYAHWNGKRGWASQHGCHMHGVASQWDRRVHEVFAELRKNRDHQLEKNCLR